MADRFPLIANSSTGRIEELSFGDNINLQGSGITSATTIVATTFVGDLQGQSSSSVRLTNAANIDSGFINPDRLSGNYNINVTLANSLSSASNIGTGTLAPQRLSGTYPIDIIGTASTSESLTDASQIQSGVIESERLSGTYNIDITGTAFRSVGAALSLTVTQDSENQIQYLTFSKQFDVDTSIFVNSEGLVYNPSLNYLGIGTNSPNVNLDVYGDVNITGIASISNLYANKLYPIEILGLEQIDAQTKVTLENALGITSLTDLQVQGISTFANLSVLDQTIINNINVTGIATIGTIELTESKLVTPELETNSLIVSGISTFNSISIGSTLIFDETRELKNLGSIDDATKNVLRSELGLDVLSDINVSGISTFENLNVTDQTDLNNINVSGIATFTTVNATDFIGSGANLTGILTSIIGGIGIDIFNSESGTEVTVQAYRPIGKTIFVTQTGDDTNSGLTDNNPKLTIKAAAAIALPGDTIKVYPGYYQEDNPIILSPQVAVEGTELRNCQIRPRNASKDLFYVNNGVHITDLSFVGSDSENGSAIISFQPLLGTSADRFFDAAKIIRLNLDFIASEAVGYLTSTDYQTPGFQVPGGFTSQCIDDVKKIFKQVCFDITRGGNSACVGAGKSYYDGSALQHIVGVKTETIDALIYAAGIAHSCVNNVLWQGNYQNTFTQVRDLGILYDPVTGSNVDIGSCSNVISAIYTCVGIVTTIIDNGLSILGNSGITTTYPGNSGIGFTTVIGITSAIFEYETGESIITAPGISVIPGDVVEIRDLLFECSSGLTTSTQLFPSGKYGYEFYVERVIDNNTFVINTGISTIAHTYISGGIIVNRSIGVSTASFDNSSGIATIFAPGVFVKSGDVVTIRNLEFSCLGSTGITTTLYPSGKLGYDFEVLQVLSPGEFVVNVGASTITHLYESGGFVRPPYSKGVGPITQGPYVRNCTNFVPKSIGMRINGFDAEPGNKDDIGVQGSMSVDSYTQFNQGGIGVSISNGAYAQLVSIFTICDDIAIYTTSGGQCDLTNSNSSFGTFGLVSEGVGDNTKQTIYNYTGETNAEASNNQNIVEVSGVGSYRPYDGQVVYFDELYKSVTTIAVIDGGSGYTSTPRVNINSPTGPNGITAQATATVENGSVTQINVVTSGTQYVIAPQVNIEPPTGAGTTATVQVSEMSPIYYRVSSSTLPSAGICTVTLLQNLNNIVSAGTTAYFSRISLQLASSHAFEFIGAGNNIQGARPAQGGVTITENEVIKLNGGDVIYTSTDQAGNFKIGDGLIINQATGTLSGRDFTKALFTQVTPFILALAD
jgi:hypothetical protein